jgi:excisionase family DNA binding protein
MSEQELLTAQEAADYLRINVKLLYKLVDTGELKAKRVGRIIRITKAAIDSYLQGDTNE